ncbi:MAG: DUF4886 domain-containing protein [Firmicutes bacterium]|nr:DUF4886 domain-containing protein [Candidatus Colimorpha enterica]
MNKKIFSGYHGKFHCQGIAVDEKNGYIYYSFTTSLVKTDLEGNFIGSVTGLAGHLGCIDFNDRDGKVYGSLEYKNDSIGKHIMKGIGESGKEYQDKFYAVIFDVDKIDRADMDAKESGIMRAVYLSDPTEDYAAETAQGKHRYGCSGIDGTDWGFVPGTKDYRLNICYGIYSELDRTDNDYQVIVSYDAADWWDRYGKPVSIDDMHTCGPEKAERKLFVFTGNTEWGVQNLEADKTTGDWYLAVYYGHKKQYLNPPMFVVDGSVAPKWEKHVATGEDILTLTVKGFSQHEYGSTGLQSLSDGNWLISHDGAKKQGRYTNLIYTPRNRLEAIPFYNKDDELNIFAVGNSFSVNGMRYLRDIFVAEGWTNVTLGDMYIGGCSLERHYNNLKSGAKDYTYFRNEGEWEKIPDTDLETGIKDKKWNVMTLQQQGGRSGMYETYLPYAEEIAKWQRENGAKRLLWHSVWHYLPGSTQGFCEWVDKYGGEKEFYGKNCEASELIGGTGLFDGNIPSNKAIKRACRLFGEENVYCSDRAHLSDFGCLIAGYVWYEAITGRKVKKLSFTLPAETLGFEMNDYLEKAILYVINNANR